MNPPILLQRLRSVHRHLADGGYDHAVGGALALAVHVKEPRFTADIDLNVMASASAPEPLLACLPSDLEPHPGAAEAIRRDGQVRLWWREPNTPLDLFLPMHPTFHAQAAARAVPVDFLGEDIKVLTATDLMVFKALFARSKDFVDIESLGESRAGDIDEAAAWLREILGEGSTNEQRMRESWLLGAESSDL